MVCSLHGRGQYYTFTVSERMEKFVLIRTGVAESRVSRRVSASVIMHMISKTHDILVLRTRGAVATNHYWYYGCIVVLS